MLPPSFLEPYLMRLFGSVEFPNKLIALPPHCFRGPKIRAFAVRFFQFSLAVSPLITINSIVLKLARMGCKPRPA